MDDKFMETLKSMSKEMLDEQQRPGTAAAMQRPPTGRNPIAVGMARPPSGFQKIDNSEVTTLASYRPESAAFTFSFNRPRTGRMDIDRGQQRGVVPPPARPNRSGLTSSRARSSLRQSDEGDSYIPDLDEVREEDFTTKVASAPAYELQRIATLTELNEELAQTRALSVIEGVNVRKLCKYLVPEIALLENDEYWTWDRLYTEIMSSPELGRLKIRGNDNDFDSLS